MSWIVLVLIDGANGGDGVVAVGGANVAASASAVDGGMGGLFCCASAKPKPHQSDNPQTM